jgi:hypothetical protein
MGGRAVGTSGGGGLARRATTASAVVVVLTVVAVVITAIAVFVIVLVRLPLVPPFLPLGRRDGVEDGGLAVGDVTLV